MSTNRTCNSSSWTREQDKAFENALAIYSEDSVDRWEKIAAMVPGKSVEEIKNHYVILLEDINAIESGSVPLPHYVPSINDYTNLSSDFGVSKMGSHYGQMQSDSHHGGNSGKPSVSDQERRRGIAWTEEEHRLFLLGLEKYGKGDWRSISRNFVVSRTPTQVASHAQKYFIRLSLANKEGRRSSIHDITSIGGGDTSTPRGPITGQMDRFATTGSFSSIGKHAPSNEPEIGTYIPPNIVESIDTPMGPPPTALVSRTPTNMASMTYLKPRPSGQK
ncbi:transcription factor SRM1-like isoform X2 [Actinidia eriantha]|nr:transcription factor SRM1-like isoform X2 [Actinidia eriantha]